MSLTAYDGLLGRRSAALGVALGAIVFLVMLGTDDVVSTHAGRLGRLAALSPLAGAAGTLIAVAQARSRGELRALGAAGIAPFRASLGGIWGGTLVGLLGAMLAIAPGVDLSPLFPRALPTEGGWVRDGASWLDTARGVRVAIDGAVSWADARADLRPVGAAPFGATLTALVLAAIAFPVWATAPGTMLRRAAVCFGVASAAVFVFHLVAAQRTSSMFLVLPPLILLADAWMLHRGRAWS
ncbi:MAG: hypothetical protein ABW133_09705 [Polyangiaceae bacterium]